LSIFLFPTLGLAQGWAHLGQGPGERKKGKRVKKRKKYRISLYCQLKEEEKVRKAKEI